MAPISERLWTLKKWATRLVKAYKKDEHIDGFIGHNERKRGDLLTRKTDFVVLIGQHDWVPYTYCLSLVAPDIANRKNARIETFDFHHRRDPLVDRLFHSFGARRTLVWGDAEKFDAKAIAMSDEIFSSLRGPWDVMNIHFEGVKVGDIFYDTYLRQFVKATVELTDSRLKKLIYDGAKIFLAVQEYFATRNVVAVIPWRTVYLKCGIITRVAQVRNVPVYQMPYRPAFFLLPLDPTLSSGMCNPTKRFPYYRYREVFQRLSPQEQKEGRDRARDHLAKRLSGELDEVLEGRSAYNAPVGARILLPTSKPKILILLHDFCDAVHSFRRMLFPDFYEWAKYTFAAAEKTEFEWYAKPHPNSLTDQSKNILNKQTIAALSAGCPGIHILDAAVSNRQLVDEGIVAMFTVHGTAGHEFASMGVTVVNAGDNLHVDFDFNITPSTVEEYAQCIANAGRLGHKIDQAQVEAFYYMHYFYCREQNCSEVNPIEPDWRSHPDFDKKARPHTALSYFLQTETPGKMRKLTEYFGLCSDKKPENLTVKGL
jgi:hypothetical protein